MTDRTLADLLELARAAGPANRIGYRDEIAAHGAAAVAALRSLITDASMRAFAIRTIERAATYGARDQAIEALRGLPADAPEHIRRDASDALGAARIARPPLARPGPSAVVDRPAPGACDRGRDAQRRTRLPDPSTARGSATGHRQLRLHRCKRPVREPRALGP